MELDTSKIVDHSLNSPRAFVDVVSGGDVQCMNLGPQVFFNGEGDFIDPATNLRIGKLKGIRYNGRRYYMMLWQDKYGHPKMDHVWNVEHQYHREPFDPVLTQEHSNAYDRLNNLLISYIRNSYDTEVEKKPWVIPVEADDFFKRRKKPNSDEMTYTVDMDNLDYDMYFSTTRGVGEDYWQEPLRSVKYTFKSMRDLLKEVNDRWQQRMILGVPLPELCVIPEKLMMKLTSKMLSGQELTTSRGKYDVEHYMKPMQDELHRFHILKDIEKINAEREVLI